MRKKTSVILGLILFVLTSLAQEIHDPAEIFKIIEESPVTYELSMLEEAIPIPDRSENLNYNNCYRVTTFKYEIKGLAKEYLERAEAFYTEHKFSQARDMYLKVLEADSTMYEVMTYIGQMYENEGDIKHAIEWYQTTIKHNYIDYMAHWFLADAYKSQGDLDKAVDEITIAMILNRNNPRIKKSMSDIYNKKKLKTIEWEFNPQMKIDSINKDNVKIEFDTDWLGYAMVKAIWAYEPGYSESMGVEPGTFSTSEEKEGILSLMMPMDKKKMKKVPEFKALNLAIEHHMITSYILYEILLPQYPITAYQLPEETINDIKDYVIQVRGKVK
jgi:tetratricopeptide (TPR) repeat protein